MYKKIDNFLNINYKIFKTGYSLIWKRCEFNLLIKYLKMLYQKWNITNKQFPRVIEFYHLLVTETKNDASTLMSEFVDIIATDFLNDGKYEKLWNGHTTLTFNN